MSGEPSPPTFSPDPPSDQPLSAANPPAAIALLRRPYNWRLLAILSLAMFLSVILLTPYAISLQADALKKAHLPLPLKVLLPLQWVGSTILYGACAGIGLFAAGKIGLGLPFLEGWLAGKPVWKLLRRYLLPAILVGAVAGIAILLLSHFVFSRAVEADLKRHGIPIPTHLNPPAWQGLLASFYGGITEEVLLRLFVMSLLVWLGRYLTRSRDVRPSLGVLWVANFLAAVLFGLGHLPAAAALGLPLDAVAITQIVVLNGLAGIAFGWLYWTFGLEAAMISHFSADIVLHVIQPSMFWR